MSINKTILNNLCEESLSETQKNIETFIRLCAKKDLCVESVVIGLLNEAINITFKYTNSFDQAFEIISAVLEERLYEENLVSEELVDLIKNKENRILH
jgi:hypothetical protein